MEIVACVTGFRKRGLAWTRRFLYCYQHFPCIGGGGSYYSTVAGWEVESYTCPAIQYRKGSLRSSGLDLVHCKRIYVQYTFLVDGATTNYKMILESMHTVGVTAAWACLYAASIAIRNSAHLWNVPEIQNESMLLPFGILSCTFQQMLDDYLY